MSGAWQRRRILIWGKTRPEVSSHYRETVCTGGVFEDTGRLVRLYPIPLRYLDDTRYFKKYQWITADVARASDRDNRPESYRIRPEGIDLGDVIGTGRAGDWRDRASHVLRTSNIFASVEALQAQQQVDHTSLGLVKPKRIVQAHFDPFSKDEQRVFWDRYKAITAQPTLGLEDERMVKPLTPPDYRFRLRFTCDDPRCTHVHAFSILDWEIDALYFRMKKKKGPVGAAKAVVSTLNRICAPDRDTRFFLGNISTHPHNFTIVGFWWPKVAERSLFDVAAAP